MSKKQISENKKTANKRKNRRLSDVEYRTVMLAAKDQLGIHNDDAIEINEVSLNSYPFTLCSSKFQTTKKLAKSYSKKMVKRLEISYAKQLDLFNRFQNNTKKRRLTDKQYKDLMKKAADELGINDRKTLPILGDEPDKVLTSEDIINRCEYTTWLENPKVLETYRVITRGRKLEFKDRLWTLAYAYHLNYNHLSSKPKDALRYAQMMAYIKKPLFLISKKERINDIRKVVKPRGNVKVHPIRILPDDEYFKELTNKKRTKLDAFDKLPINKKIMWARSFVLSTNIDVENNVRPIASMNLDEINYITFMMKYCCRLHKISDFKGNFASPFWIYLRAKKYNLMTKQEANLFSSMAIKHLEGNKKSIPIIDPRVAIQKLMPTIQNLKRYRNWHKEIVGISELKRAKELIQASI